MTEKGLDAMIREMSSAFFRVTGVEPSIEQRQTVEFEIRQQFAGERVYVAGLPKGQRARQLAKLARQSAREMAAASGLPLRTVQRLRSGR